MNSIEETGLNFDYSPWQRIEKTGSAKISLLNKDAFSQSLGRSRGSSKPPELHGLSRISQQSEYHGLSKRSVLSLSSQVLPATEVPLFPNLRQECSALCHHGVRAKTPELALPEKRKSKDSNITILKLLIRERKVALQNNKERYMKLIEENFRLKNEIESFDDANHNDAKGLLTKYKKYEGAMAVLSHKHASTLAQEEMELHKTHSKTEKMLQVLRNDSQKLDFKIKEEKHALKVLHNYKEKEYPDKLEQMKHLQGEIDVLETEFVNAICKVQGIADVEKEAYIGNTALLQDDMISVLAQSSLITMDASVKDMAKRNVLIQQEIDVHQKEFRRHQNEIQQLELDIKKLKGEEKTRCARLKYPEKFLVKCSPETDFELNIPKQRYLPI